MNRYAHVACPYCGCDVRVHVEDDLRQRTVVTCDKEDGGCDRDFVASVFVRIEVKALKIEGEARNDT